VIWWGGDLSRELLDGNTITRWRISGGATNLLTATGYGAINGTKSNPVLQADLFGDWREEVIFSNGTNAIRIYTTTMPTTHRLVTLMHDPVYRVAVAWQNSSYNQPPHPGYYIASDMNFPPPELDVAVYVQPIPCIFTDNDGLFIGSLSLCGVPNINAWSIEENLSAQTKAYGDREHIITAVPAQLEGAEWIKPAMDSRTHTSDEYMEFTMKRAGTVYIAYDDRITAKPAWLAAGGFTASDMTMTVTESGGTVRTFTIYSKAFAQPQTVKLGRNSNDGTTTSMMYIVAANAGPTTSVIDKTLPMKYSLNIAKTSGGALRVNYSMKNKGPVKIDLFDIKGSKVRTFVNTSKNAGTYREQFSAGGLAAGMYIVKMKAGQRVLQERITIAR
jgi:rhamnogalacturonan endolyase